MKVFKYNLEEYQPSTAIQENKKKARTTSSLLKVLVTKPFNPAREKFPEILI